MKLMTRTELLELLDTARKGVDTGDSLEGGLEWLQPYYDPEDTIPPAPPDTFYVRVALRVGNLNGQGGMILIGPGDEPESEGEAAARGAPEPLTEEERAAVLAIQLSPCPFCGGAAGMRKTLRDGCLPAEVEAFSYGATCRSCAATGGWAKSATGAARGWNQRHGVSGG